MVVAFQNCGQPGGLSSTDVSQKADPLVVDVVNDMQNQDGNNGGGITYDYNNDKDRGKKYDDDDDKDCDKKKYDDELEAVLNDYSCDDGDGGAGKKVLVCHFPPGNAAAKHEICISRSALKAHMGHGHVGAAHQDKLGKCDAD